MKKLIYSGLIALSLSPLPALASVSGYIKMGGSYMSQADGSSFDQSRMMIDLGTGSVTDKGWTLGLNYNYEKDSGGENKTGSSSSPTRSSIGPTVGWISKREMGPYFLLSYYLFSSRSDGYTGSGYQFDGGYKVPIGFTSIALQLTYKRFSYGKLNGASVGAFNQTYVDPYIVCWIDF